MRSQVQKWGNSLGLRIPKSFAVEVGLEQGSPVELSLTGGTLVVAPIVATEETLDDLLAQVTDENLHGEVDFGPPVGKEAL